MYVIEWRVECLSVVCVGRGYGGEPETVNRGWLLDVIAGLLVYLMLSGGGLVDGCDCYDCGTKRKAVRLEWRTPIEPDGCYIFESSLSM